MRRYIGLLIGIMIICLLFTNYVLAQEESTTAMEYKVIVDEHAKEWSENATLTGVYVWGVGLITFTYSDFNNSISTDFIVSSNGDIDNRSTSSGTSPIILNWTIDNDEVKSILDNNSTFIKYINDVPDANGDLWLEQGDNNLVWHFSYEYWNSGIIDTGSMYGCRGTIDASSGELLEVETDGKKSNNNGTYVCCASAIIIVVIITYTIFKSGKQRKTPPIEEEYNIQTDSFWDQSAPSRRVSEARGQRRSGRVGIIRRKIYK